MTKYADGQLSDLTEANSCYREVFKVQNLQDKAEETNTRCNG